MSRSLGLAAVGGVGLWSLPSLAPVVPSLAVALRIPTRLAMPGAVALTFDDGPHPVGTPAVLETLARTGTRATFFMVGEQVLRNPALAGEIVAAGHMVAHSRAPSPQPLAPDARGDRRRPGSGGGGDRRSHRNRPDAPSPALRHLLLARLAGCPRSRLDADAVVALGPGLDAARHAESDRGEGGIGRA